MASSGSSTTEGASDVSLSHLFHPLPLHLPVALLVWLFGFGVWFVLLFVSPGFASARDSH